jgi:uncharacterized protein (TIGR00369 family)
VSEARIAFLETWPYARFLGMRAETEEGVLTTVLPFSQHLVGNPRLPAIHGGVVAAFLEMTALARLSMSAPAGHTPRTVDVTVDYLRSARAQTTFARADIKRLGRRVASVHVEAWQSDPAAPVAALRGNFLLLAAQ